MCVYLLYSVQRYGQRSPTQLLQSAALYGISSTQLIISTKPRPPPAGRVGAPTNGNPDIAGTGRGTPAPSAGHVGAPANREPGHCRRPAGAHEKKRRTLKEKKIRLTFAVRRQTTGLRGARPLPPSEPSTWNSFVVGVSLPRKAEKKKEKKRKKLHRICA